MAENSFTLTTYVSPFNANTSANWNAVSRQICRDQPNSWEKMRNFMVEFLKCANFTENSRKEFEKFMGLIAVISRCYVNAN